MAHPRKGSSATPAVASGSRANVRPPSANTMERERERLVAERQQELGRIMVKHDDLLRESFHLENYGFLLYYNPEEAKQDHTNEFKELQARHDLTLLLPSPGDGPSRSTRRTQTTRLSAIHQAPLPTITTPSRSSPTSITASAKGKGKETTHDALSAINDRKRRKSESVARAVHEPVLADDDSISARRGRKRKAADDLQQTLEEPVSHTLRVSLQPKRSGHRTRSISEATSGGNKARIPVEPKRVGRPKTSGKTIPASKSSVLSPAKTILPKVRLIVRQPAPSFSSPQQKPEQASFGRSLPTLISRCFGLDEDKSKLERKARRDARILNRISDLKAKGRLVRRPTLEEATQPSVHHPADSWANVVTDAIATRNATLSRHRFGRGGATAFVVHSRLTNHWDSIRKEERLEVEREERRIRALASGVMKAITAEWYRVFLYIREQEKREEEEEVLRRGKRHLEAILDQSGQILEKQQSELVREVEDYSETSMEESEADEDGLSAQATSEAETESAEESSTALLLPGSRVPSAFADVNDRRSSTVGTATPRSASIFDDERRSDSDFELADIEKQLNGFSLQRVDETSTAEQLDDELLPDQVTVEEDGDAESNDMGFEATIKKATSPTKKSAAQRPSSPTIDRAPSPPSPESNFRDSQSADPYARGHSCSSADQTLPTPTSTLVLETDFSTCGNGNHNRNGIRKDTNGTKSPQSGQESPLASPYESANGHRAFMNDKRGHECNLISDASPGAGAAETAEGEVEVGKARPVRVYELHERDDGRPIDETPQDMLPYAITQIRWSPEAKILPPLLLRGNLRPYQQSGLEWLVSLHNNKMNGILADEMGLGKTIQTIALLAHLACDRGIWGPHLIIVPTSVLLNWEMEFKKFLPGFKILSYHGSVRRRKELRQGWNNRFSFNVCVTSYTLAIKDQHIFKRKSWYYMILDEAHMIKNFKSQRWNILLMFKSYRRLLLTGTPLQNNLTELWALLQFLMSGANFANQREFNEWFSNPLEKAIEQGNVQDSEVQLQVGRLHSVLRPYLLRRLKADVERELPKKYDHLVLCRLSKRQRFLYDEFMSRSQTKEDLKSGVYQKIANILMQLRKVCNHPDLFEVRPIVTSFAMDRSAIADFEIKELLVRRRLLADDAPYDHIDLDTLNLRFVDYCEDSLVASSEAKGLEASLDPKSLELPSQAPETDYRTVRGFQRYAQYRKDLDTAHRYRHMQYLNHLRCGRTPVYGAETITCFNRMHNSVSPAEQPLLRLVKSYALRTNELSKVVEKFAFATPPAVARDLPSIALRSVPPDLINEQIDSDAILHNSAVKLQIAFPDLSLLQYDCGKLQKLAELLRERKSGGHRVLIFTQMTRILDILEVFLNFHGYLYLRLDGATKIEDRQYITERFNIDTRVFVFIASSRSGGVGINLTGADTVVFYDSDFNPQMDRQCEDRAHRIGQVRDVHIYRFISQHTVEEAMLKKANQKRYLDDLVIQKGEFDWQSFFRTDEGGTNPSALQRALVEFEDFEDVNAARIAAREEAVVEGEEREEFDEGNASTRDTPMGADILGEQVRDEVAVDENDEEEGGTVTDYMLRVVRSELEFFRSREWRVGQI